MQSLANMTDRRFVPLRSAMDRLFDSTFSPLFGGSWTPQWTQGVATWPVNVYEDGDGYYLHALIPGVDPEELQITAQPSGYLTIAGEVKPQHPENARAVWSEFGTQQFRRDIALPVAFDADKAEVSYEHGVLAIRLPKKPEARARQIKVLTNGKGK